MTKINSVSRSVAGRWLLVAGCSLSAACTSSATQEPAAAALPTTHYVVALDRSTSIHEAEQAAMQRTVEQLIQSLDYGDRFSAYVVYSEGRRDGTPAVTREMPDALNPANPLQTERSALASARESLARAVAPMFDVEATEYTDLLSSLRQAEEQLRPSDADARVLVMLSDMLHCRPGDAALCMDRSSWSGAPSGWSDGALIGGAGQGLADVCVWIVGAETAGARDLAVRDFWGEYFGMMGARFDASRYYHSLDRAPGSC